MNRPLKDVCYSDDVTLKEVWDAMRAAADSGNYKTAHQIAKTHEVAWMCSICIERHVSSNVKAVIPYRLNEFNITAPTHDYVEISMPVSTDRMRVCDTCYKAWRNAVLMTVYARPVPLLVKPSKFSNLLNDLFAEINNE